MNDGTRDPIADLLHDLAARADRTPSPPDRLGDVRRRARHAALVRAGTTGGVAVIAVVAGVTLAFGGPHRDAAPLPAQRPSLDGSLTLAATATTAATRSRSGGPGSASATGRSPGKRDVVSRSAAPRASRPHRVNPTPPEQHTGDPSGSAATTAPSVTLSQKLFLDVAIAVDAQDGRTVTVSFTADGVVRAPDVGGRFPESSELEVQGVAVDFGDGATSGSDPGDARCVDDGPVRPLHNSWPLEPHTYAAAGTYTVTLTTSACGVGERTATLQVTVP